MTVDEVARELECSPALVYKLCDRKRLGFSRIGFGRGKITVSREQLDAYRLSCEEPPVPGGVEPEAAAGRRAVKAGVRDRVAEVERRRRPAR